MDHVGHARAIDALLSSPVHPGEHLIIVYIQRRRHRQYREAGQTQVDVDLVEVKRNDGYLKYNPSCIADQAGGRGEGGRGGFTSYMYEQKQEPTIAISIFLRTRGWKI